MYVHTLHCCDNKLVIAMTINCWFFTESDEMNPLQSNSEVWPSDINNIPHTSPWLPGMDVGQDENEDSSVFSETYRGMRPIRPSLQMQRLPGNYSGVFISNPNIPLSLRRIVTSKNKQPNPGPSLSFHKIQYAVKRRRCNFIGNSEPYPILKGIR